MNNKKRIRRIREPVYIELKRMRINNCDMCIETEKEIFILELDLNFTTYMAEKLWVFVNRNQNILDGIKQEIRNAEVFGK